MISVERFVRVPTAPLEALLRMPITGGQWRLLLWVIRFTYGWNRSQTTYSWNRIAQDLKLDRSAVYRAGQALIRSQILAVNDGYISLQADQHFWNSDLAVKRSKDRQLWIVGCDVAQEQRRALSGDIQNVAAAHSTCGREATPLRRAKDSRKEQLKTKKDRQGHPGLPAQVFNHRRQRLLEGAAQPIPGKYDGLSKN